MFDDFDRKRRPVLTEVCREFYPVGVAGLVKTVDQLADECPYDENHRLLTTRPVEAVRKGACGFHGNLTSPARRWFRFRDVTQPVEDQSTSEAMDHLTEAVETTLRASDIYPNLYKLYEHVLVAGFGCMLVTAGRNGSVLNATTLRIGTYAMDVGTDGRVCRVVRRFSWTAEQILSEFGPSGVPRSVIDAAEKYDSKKRWTVVNIIEPNAVGDLRAYDRVAREIGLDDTMIYRTVYWLECGKDTDPQNGILKISGFSVCPIVAPRLDRENGDVYGRGRGIDALCAARGCQSFEYDILNVSGIKGKQPLVVSSEFKDEGFKAGRGGVNYARFGEQRGALAMPVFASLPDTNDLRVDRQDLENEIADLFFNSSFATIDALKNNPGVKTATEVDALIRENMERLNPVITNLDRELLDPLVTVACRYTLAAGVPPLSDEDMDMIGDGVNVEYVSQIHLAAKNAQIGALDNWLNHVASVSQAKPESLDKIDADALVDEYADMLGVPARVRTDEKAVAAVRQQRQQQQQMAQEQQQMAAISQMAKLGAVPTDKQHLGGLIMDGLGGSALGGMAQ